MSPSIDVNDFNVKLRNAQKFLAEGNRVKVTVRFRGREMAHTDIGNELLVRFAEQCAEVANWTRSPSWKDAVCPSSSPPSPPRKPDTSIRKGETTMPKLKTHSGAKKRFNLTKTGKVKTRPRLQEPPSRPSKPPSASVASVRAPMRTTNVPAIKRMIPYK